MARLLREGWCGGGRGWACAFLLWLCLSAPAAWGGDLIIPGSGSPEYVLGRLARSFNAEHRDVQVRIPASSGTMGGIRAVMRDEATLARVARPLKPAESAAGLGYLPFARDAVVFAVGAEVTLPGITAAQAVDIFAGRISNWEELGGPRAPIRVVGREETDTSLTVIHRVLSAFRGLLFSPDAKIVNRDPEMVSMLDRYPTAIGILTTSGVMSARSRLGKLSLDGIPPTPENVATGVYRLAVDYAFVFREERLDAGARQFIDYVFSEAGRAELARLGMVPLPRH